MIFPTQQNIENYYLVKFLLILKYNSHPVLDKTEAQCKLLAD